MLHRTQGPLPPPRCAGRAEPPGAAPPGSRRDLQGAPGRQEPLGDPAARQGLSGEAERVRLEKLRQQAENYDHDNPYASLFAPQGLEAVSNGQQRALPLYPQLCQRVASGGEAIDEERLWWITGALFSTYGLQGELLKSWGLIQTSLDLITDPGYQHLLRCMAAEVARFAGQPDHASWKSTQARLLKVTSHETQHHHITKMHVGVVYTYQVQGRTYRGNRARPDEAYFTYSDANKAENKLGRLKGQTHVTVYSDPAAPEKSALERKPAATAWYAIGAWAGALLLLIITLLILRHHIRRRRALSVRTEPAAKSG